MFAQSDLIYRYDGTLDGFLCCVFESYAKKERPQGIIGPEEYSLFPVKEIPTQRDRAFRVWNSIPVKMSPRTQDVVYKTFCSCEPGRELLLLDFLYLGFSKGPDVLLLAGDARVDRVLKAARALEKEASHLMGFLRFSDYSGVLVAEMEPKNRVLPFLSRHFATRFPRESFMIYDRTHREALLSRAARTGIFPLDGYRPPRPDQKEEEYRALWREFYETIAIPQRENLRCRQTHMPKRFWGTMTEFQAEPVRFGAGEAVLEGGRLLK